MATLLDYLHRGGVVAHYWTPNTEDYYTTDEGEQIERKHSIWFPVEKRPAVPAGWMTRNVYFCVHPCASVPDKTKSGTRANPKYTKSRLSHVSVVNCFFGEFDAKHYDGKDAILAHLKTLPIYPSVIVDSGGGFHCYWLLDEPHQITEDNRTTIKEIQYAWVDLVGSDNDAKDLARVLRVPGTKNLKPAYGPDFPTVTILHEDYSAVYQFSQFDELTKEARSKPEKTNTYTGESSFTDDITTAARCLKALAAHRRDNYGSWVEVGMSLTQLGAAGLQMWEEWSQSSSKYETGECGRKWRTFEADANGLGLGSLVKWAKEDDPGYGLRFYGNGTNGHSNGHSKNVAEPQDDDPDDDDQPEDDVPTADETANQPPDDLPEEIDIEQYFIYQSADDEGNAQCVNKIHGKDFLYCDAYGWMHNIGTHWTYSGLAEKAINLSITQTLIDRRIAAVRADNDRIIKATKPSASNKENTKRQFKDIVWGDVGIFDRERHLLNCKNGVVDLRSGKLIAHGPSNYFTYCVDAEYHPDTSDSEWTSFLADTVKDYAMIKDWLQMACGYSITGFTNEEIMFYIFGPTRSGKGTFTNAFLSTLGEPLARGINFSTFTARRDGDSQNFDLAPLKPCRFVSASESGKYQALNEAVVKNITGNDPITACFKHQTPFTFIPQFKVWLSSNHPVKGDVDDDAFWGRVKVLEFPNSHLGEEDKALKLRMQSAAMRAAILTYAVTGSTMWYHDANGLVTPQTIKESTEKQRSDADSVQGWMDECTVKGEKCEAFNSELYASYVEWCKDNGHTPRHSVGFGRAMNKKGMEQIKMRRPGSNPARGYRGIGLLTDNIDGCSQM